MSKLDDKLEQLFHELAIEPPTGGVVDAVETKRSHRRTVRRAQVAGSVAAIALLAVGLAALLWPTDTTSPVVSPPPTPGALVVRVADGSASVVDPSTGTPTAAEEITVEPAAGFLRGPVQPSGEFVSLAAYDRDGSGFKFPPTRFIRIDSRGRVLDRVDLQGEVLSSSDGEGARWALTRDAIVIGPEDPEFRVKRIGPDGELVSNAVPPGEIPNGDIVAAGGGVWVPVQDGALRFDPATGEYAGKVPLDVDARRTIVNAGKGVVATAGNRIERLNPASLQSVPYGPGATAERVIAIAAGRRNIWALVEHDSRVEVGALDPAGYASPVNRMVVPTGFVAENLESDGGLVWVSGTVEGRPALLLLQERDGGARAEVARYARIGSGRDVSFVVMPGGELVTAVDGRLFRHDLGN
jgi:hypothetical protein